MRRRVAWALVVPALVGGELIGHSLAYRIVAPNATTRGVLLERTGHAYLSYLHPVFAVCLVLVLAALARRVLASFRGAPAGSVASWRVALLPSAAFLLQEYVERFAYHGHVVWGTIAESAVAVGIVLQIPVGFVVLGLLRILLRAAERVGAFLAERRPAGVERLISAGSWTHRAERPTLVALARGGAERAPPLPA